MSKVGKVPVVMPEGVSSSVAGDVISVKGKLGELAVKIHPSVGVTVADGRIVVLPKDMNDKVALVMWGTQRSHINNAVIGVSEGFKKKLIFKGVGYKVALKGDILDMVLGFSHNVEHKIPAGVKVTVVTPTEVEFLSASKELLGSTCDEIRKWRPPEPYKGKGIAYEGEHIRRKEGKKK